MFDPTPPNDFTNDQFAAAETVYSQLHSQLRFKRPNWPIAETLG
jgi:hypothetical protein